MAHVNSKDTGTRIWEGDIRVVDEARWRFKEDGNILPYAVALYSFRANKYCVKELLTVRDTLLEFARNFNRNPEKVSSDPKAQANIADTLSTHLAWIGRRHDLPYAEREVFKKEAWVIALQGLQTAEAHDIEGHTPLLIDLTLAELLIQDGEFDDVYDRLKHIGEDARTVSDHNQQTRVYAKVGLLYRKAGAIPEGIFWGVRALFVSGVPLAVRAKALAAFLGIER